MVEKKKQEEGQEEPFELDLGGGKFSLGGIFKGLGKLVDFAEKLEQAGGELKKQGEFKVKGAKDLKGIYGFSIRSGIGKDGKERPIVQSFGNVRKTPEGAVVEDSREPIVDTFDEAETIQIVAEMPGVSEEEIEYTIKGDVVILSTTGAKKYSKEILLSSPASEEGVERSYKNGIFELKLKKSD